MPICQLVPLALLVVCGTGPSLGTAAEADLPRVPEGFVVDVVATEPHVRNPCVLAFDRDGRLFVGQGPQWRGPTPQTPGDRVDLLLEDDGDGRVDARKAFAEGFNSIQGLAWKGRDLWVANAPDLTIVRDLDGDDVADEYVRLFTGLGNLEHSVHGLNFGPDGKLYLSKGNSKGLDQPGQRAPRPFRELWGLPSGADTAPATPPEVFPRESYRRNYHPPQDDWGQRGGILRCDPDGSGLEIVARGFRNPWDIAFDDGFDWLGTDNDQTDGDRILRPIYGGHYGWGHPWSHSWTGEGHLPTLPVAAPPFEGSGTGVVYSSSPSFPPEYRDVFFVGDWLRREILLFRPQWQGAGLRCAGGSPSVFAHAEGGRTLPSSSGILFDPTDLEIGPDGALYVLSWGHGYGGTLDGQQQTDAGRVYRIRYEAMPSATGDAPRPSVPLAEWSPARLLADLDSPVPARRVDAQDELLRRGTAVLDDLLAAVAAGTLTKRQETWTIWAIGRLPGEAERIEAWLLDLAEGGSSNGRIQAIRVLGHRARSQGASPRVQALLAARLRSPDARHRFEAVQAIHQAGLVAHVADLVELLADESDRVTFYAAWNGVRELAGLSERLALLGHRAAGVRLGALLGLLHDDAITATEVSKRLDDADPRVASLAADWLAKTGSTTPLVELDPPPGEYSHAVSVRVRATQPGHRLTYTLDGSTPSPTAPMPAAVLPIGRTATLKIAPFAGSGLAGRIVTAEYRIVAPPEYPGRRYLHDLRVASNHRYDVDWQGLLPGKYHYTDRVYRVRDVPPELQGLPFLRTANADDRSQGDAWLTFESEDDVTVFIGVDARLAGPLDWMRVGEPEGFEPTSLEVVTDDPTFRIYRKEFSAGRIVLGGNSPAQGNPPRGNYIVIFGRELLGRSGSPVTLAEVLTKLPTADVERGRELFLHRDGAGCYRCHRLDGIGTTLAPDLTDVGTRSRKPEAIISSILDPSAVITEGFAQQRVLTVDGELFEGAVLEETGRSLRLADSQGNVITIAKDAIEVRQGSKLSPMPADFATRMTAQQVADVTAWLRGRRVVGTSQGFQFRDAADKLDVYYGSQRIATYLKRHHALTRPALVNLRTLGGLPVTRNFPPRKPEDLDPGYTGEDGIIHPVMHAGLWISYGDLDGNDYWRLAAPVEHAGFVGELSADVDEATFTARHRYLTPGAAEEVCTETVTYHWRRVPQGLLLTLRARYESDEEFYFGDQEESGLAVRVAAPLRVQGGNGTIVDDAGRRNGAEIWGHTARWFDYSGTIDGRQVGVLVAANPANPRPSWLHARDYGVVVTNPFPKQPRERREPYVKTWVRAGEPFELSYAVLVHEAPPGELFDPAEGYEAALEALQGEE